MPDLVSLFGSPAGNPPFAQGTLLTFSTSTGANTVNVQGTVFANLPLLNTADSITYLPGDVVMLAQAGGSYAIMGRVFVPGGAGVFRSAQTASAVGSAVGSNFALTTSFVTAASFTVTVPAWANRVSGMIFAQWLVNAAAATGFVSTRNTFNGVSGSTFPVNAIANTETVSMTTVMAIGTAGASVVTPGASITVTADVQGGAALAASTLNEVELDGLLVFSRA